MLRDMLILLKTTEKELNYKVKENREKMLGDNYLFNLVESHNRNQFQTRHSVDILIVRVINHLI